MISIDDVKLGYRCILAREPESHFVIDLHRQLDSFEQLCRVLIDSDEFKQKRVVWFSDEKWICTSVYGGKASLWIDLHDQYVSLACLRDNYEPVETKIISRNVHKGDIAIDIGANIGWHSIGLALAVEPTGKVFCFEPRQPTFQYLVKSIYGNNLCGSVFPFPFGAWSDRTSLKLINSSNTVNPGGSFVDTMGHYEKNLQIESQSIDLIRIDNVLSFASFIKIDIEGAEYRALQGATDLLTRSHPIVLSEIFPDQLKKISNCTPDEYINSFKNLGYRCYILDERQMLTRIDEYPQNYDRELLSVIFSPINRSIEF